MPSISQAKLDELNQQVQWHKERSESNAADLSRASDKLRQFDKVLDKIELAAEGRSLVSNRDGYLNAGGNTFASSYSEVRVPKVKTEERQAQEIAALNQQVTYLQSRLAAVVAVAQFAKEHKA